MTTLVIDKADAGSEHVVRLAGEVDVFNSEDVRGALVESAGATVVVDLSELSFIDSSGIAALVRGRREIEARGQSLVLRNPQDPVSLVFETLGMENWLSS